MRYILIIDATRGFEGQDQSILVSRNRKGVVILNKCGFEKKPCQPVITKKIKQELMPFTDVPILLRL
jgi:GTP-binding protein